MARNNYRTEGIIPQRLPCCKFQMIYSVLLIHMVWWLLFYLTSQPLLILDPRILLRRLYYRHCVSGTALQCFESYLSDRMQSVVIDGIQSESSPLTEGVPQGSVLGPLYFTMYTAPLEDLIRPFECVNLIHNLTCLSIPQIRSL